MPQELIQISVRSLPVRLLTLVLLFVAGIGSYFAVRWYIGNTMAEYFNTTQNSMDVALKAVSFAPDDPLPHWRLAQVSEKILPLDQQRQAIASYEKAVSLSPNDYRFWMALGRAYEQTGDPAKAEEALRRAVALAPSYSYPHWYLGNLLLRNARYDEAFAELRIASVSDAELQPQLFNLVWQIYDGDPEALEKAVGESPVVRAQFALYLITQKQFEDGMRLWDGLSGEEKKANRDTGEAIITGLRNDAKYHDALKVWNDVAPEKYHAEMGKVSDGSFEENIGGGTVFGWQVKSAPQMQAGIDDEKGHDSRRSLRMAFRVPANLEQVNVAQLIAVLPGTEYDFECYVSTEKLETGSAPQVQILDAASSAVLASSAQAPGGTNDWSRISLTFKTGDMTQAVVLKVVRVSCSDDQTPVCPIFGSVWYDDFSIKRRN